ncbi:addiction module toxin, GnsA/GnsB family, partial [Escherichia coli]|nr:addiction module toxin, GnsA/GnsB family [Escherichia coli]
NKINQATALRFVTSIQFTAREKMTGLESYDVKINLI